jgi:hypothetical protein
MSHKLKVLGLACVAVFALTAVSASSAMAMTSGFTVGAGATRIEGTQTTALKLVIGTGAPVTIKCSTSTLNDAISEGLIHEATVTPFYGGAGACTFAGLAATVTVSSCTYTITDTAAANTYNVDVTNCPSSAPIKVTLPSTGCVVTITNQGALADVDATNNATTSPDDVDLTLTIAGIAFTGNALCPASIAGPCVGGTMTGGYTVKAFNGNTQVSLTTD